MKKEVGIAIKVRKQVTSSNHSQQIYPILGTIITQIQMHALTKHFLAHPQNLIPTLPGALCIYILY